MRQRSLSFVSCKPIGTQHPPSAPGSSEISPGPAVFVQDLQGWDRPEGRIIMCFLSPCVFRFRLADSPPPPPPPPPNPSLPFNVPSFSCFGLCSCFSSSSSSCPCPLSFSASPLIFNFFLKLLLLRVTSIPAFTSAAQPEACFTW